MQNYKFLNHIVLWNVFFAIICIPTAGKLIDVMGIPLSISIYYFPFVFIFGDILTEVYGYAVARRVLWYCIFAQILTIVIFEFVIFYPPSAVMTNNQSTLMSCPLPLDWFYSALLQCSLAISPTTMCWQK